jgi:3'-phosphoadenosine 5'-phosphosulfate sulfotransferase (PAPS reductase)/FAD synthetase
MEVLQFSGGVDSLACLELLKNTPGLVVLTASTDGAYPEREDYLKKVAAYHPHLVFQECYRDRHLEMYGRPVDVVPVKFTTIGHIFGLHPIKYQPYYECCNRSLWYPMEVATRQLGATTVYRGQRGEDALKGPINDGHVEDGVTYRFPIQDWSRERVMEFVNARCKELVPPYYGKEQTSRDCWDCTAYLHENLNRIRNLPPEKYKEVSEALEEWRRDINDETRW